MDSNDILMTENVEKITKFHLISAKLSVIYGGLPKRPKITLTLSSYANT